MPRYEIKDEISDLKIYMVDTDTLKFLVALGYIDVTEAGHVQLTEHVVQKNMAICKRCNTLILSLSRHDFVSCNCEEEKQCFVDGGDEYHRRGGDPEQMIFPTRRRIESDSE